MKRFNDKAYVSIYCKIYTENFSNEMIDRYATGKEIYNFLLKDAQCCLPLTGDINLWYLGSNEKIGHIIYKEKVWHWGWGESSFDTVQDFIDHIYQDGLFTKHQYRKLSDKIEEGRVIGSMYSIGAYLLAKSNNQATNTITSTKENSYVL